MSHRETINASLNCESAAAATAAAASATAVAGSDASSGVWQLWIDRGGGFRLLTAPQISLGGGGDRPLADVAVRGPWPRRAAVLQRRSDGDWLYPAGAGSGRPLGQQETLTWNGCSLHYRRPTPLSRSARLTASPPVRFVDSIDAVVWMADSLLLGPEAHNHVQIHSLSSQGLVIFCTGHLSTGQMPDAGSQLQWSIRGRQLAAEKLTIGQVWRHADWSLMIRAGSDAPHRSANE